MLDLEKIKGYLSPVIIDSTYAQEIPRTYDALAIRLADTDYTLLQIDTKRNTQLSVDEQIQWEANVKLPQPIENYITAVTLYSTEESLQALVAALEKTKLQEIITFYQNQQITLTAITSQDQQFVFYKKPVIFYKYPIFLQKLNSVLICSSICLILLCISIALWDQTTRHTRDTETHTIHTELQKLEEQYAQQQAAVAYQTRLTKNKEQVLAIRKFLESLKTTPPSIVLDDVSFGPDKSITLRGTTHSAADIERFGKTLQKTSRKTILISSTKSDQRTSFEYLVPGPTLRKKNNETF